MKGQVQATFDHLAPPNIGKTLTVYAVKFNSTALRKENQTTRRNIAGKTLARWCIVGKGPFFLAILETTVANFINLSLRCGTVQSERAPFVCHTAGA